ncbi:MAG: efflux RND transporter permease subunit, partial [Candidatus Eremiobacteraeota bacterium]|nr:efflux RND transporter permease subunit [Candidatus Eremiobacteraeota bacterium]
MSITRLFIKRPTLVFVLVSVMMFAGILATITIVKELYPDVTQPTITIFAQYSGASVTEMRDNIVQPIEQALAGTPDLQTTNAVVQQGQASITATFYLESDQATDLALTQKAVQTAEKQLPTNMTPPTVNIQDPAESTVVTLAAYSNKLSLSQLSLYAQNVIAPDIEQVPGVSLVNVGGVVTPAYEIQVDPTKLVAAGLTLTDVISAVSNNNQRVPGGYAYEPNRQTTIDVRGDIQDLRTVEDLPVIPAAPTTSSSAQTAGQVTNYEAGISSLPGTVDPWTASSQVVRIRDVAKVVAGYEPRQQFAQISGRPGLFLSCQKAANASEVDVSNAILRALPQIERQFPEIDFRIINVQSRFTSQQIGIVVRTLAEAILLTALAMVFFLRSWRSAIVVCISIPTSLAIAVTTMKLLHFTIDTISLLA